VTVPRLLPCVLLLATSIALSGCIGGGESTPQLCLPGAGAYPIFPDPMTQPPAGATGVSTTIGSITVPPMDNVLGATLQIGPANGGLLQAGEFVMSGPVSLTATIPKLQPNTVYRTLAVGVPCGPDFDFGQFTTGAT
jgi:hypothetical protein